MKDWATFFTDLDAATVAVLCDPAKTHPRQAKEEVAKAIIRRYHGDSAAEAAAESFRRVFTQREVPAEMPEVRVPAGAVSVASLVSLCVPDKSKGELKRLVEQGAVTVDGTKLTDPKAPVDPKDGAVLKAGKLTFVRIRRA
jgi:tyrosyl-tRNA synthetase